MKESRYGIFVSYRRKYSFFAGRIYDYLDNQGLAPFMDVYKMKQGNFVEEINEKISHCPYFLLVLDVGCFDGLKKDDVFYIEMLTALNCKAPEDILIVAGEGFSFPSGEELPSELRELGLHHHQCDQITHKNFAHDMKQFLNNIQFEKINGIVNWKACISKNGATVIGSRSYIENRFATFENRFGKELVASVRDNQPYEGPQRIKQIRMACYAASIIFAPDRNMVDDRAFDNGLLFNTFGELLRDPEFSLEIIINAPYSTGAKVAIRNKMLGNRALEEHPEAVFLSAYINVNRLITEVDEFKQAYREKRFRFYLIDTVMTGAIFQIVYKPEWSEFDHIKYDIYSYNIPSNMDRRCMIFFKSDNEDNYKYMENIYNYMKDQRYRPNKTTHDEWMQKWACLQEELK